MSVVVQYQQPAILEPLTEKSGGLASGGAKHALQQRRSQAVRIVSGRPQLKSSASLRTLFATAAVTIVATLAVTQLWKTRFVDAGSPQLHREAAVKTVQIDRPARATTSNVVLPATIRPLQIATLYARANGYLTVWHKDLGAQVKANEILAEIETPELDQEVAEGKALAREAAMAAVQARVERQEAEADLKVAEAQLARAKADAELAASLLVRREKLLTSRTITQEEFDTYQKQSEARAADVNAAKADVARRGTSLATRSAIIDTREATAKSREANVARLLELQSFKRIVAPFDGVVTHRTAEVGMLVSAGKDALFVVEDMSRVRVQTYVPQAYSLQAKQGVAATVSVPEATSQAMIGTITRIADSVDSTSRTMLAEIELENFAGRFQPGSYAQVGLTVMQDASSWTIPTNTLQMRVEGPHVAVVNDQDQVEIRAVSLGRDLGNRVVAKGLSGNERLIVNPSDDLVTGLLVKVTKAAEIPPTVALR